MQAWVVDRPGPLSTGPLSLVELPAPQPAAGEVLVEVEACGVCRTDLHLAAGDLPARAPSVVPGHEIVGRVVARGARSTRFAIGERVGVAWLRSTCGTCRFCRSGRENLCLRPAFTGWDAHGGYAELTTVDEAFAYPLPAEADPAELAPLLCSGIIGWRALRRCDLPPGGHLGIYGFGGSAHLTAQIARARGAEVHVRTRAASARAHALSLGAASVGASDDPLPIPLDAAILFAPAGELVPVALAGLDRGGTLVIAGIHLTDVPALAYPLLFQERQVRSVTANTRGDGEELLRIASRLGVRPTVRRYGFDEVPTALADLAGDGLTGAAVITMT